MTDYKALKVSELKDLLQKRALAVSGNKADLVARLENADSHQTPPSQGAAKTGEAPPVEAESKATPSAATAAPNVSGKVAPQTDSKVVPTSTADPATTDEVDGSRLHSDVKESAKADVAGSDAKAPTQAGEPPKSYAANLPSSEVDAELEKRKKRASRFGITAEQSGEAQKTLERAKRFGIGSAEADHDDAGASAIKGLDSSLPERMRKEKVARGNKRESEDEGGRDPKRSKPQRDEKAVIAPVRDRPAKSAAAGGVLSDPRERVKAEERAKRFAVKA